MTELNLTEPGAPNRATEPAAAFADIRDALGELVGRLVAEQVPDDDWIDYADHLAYGAKLARQQAMRGEQRIGGPATADTGHAMSQVGRMLLEESGRIIVHPPPARRLLAMVDHLQTLAKILRAQAVVDVPIDIGDSGGN